MGGRAAAALGLVTGLVAGGLVVGAVIALTPPPPSPVVAPRTPPPSAAPTASASPAPTASAPAASASPSPVAPGASGEPSADPGSDASVIGEPAPPLRQPRAADDTVDLADYRGKPARYVGVTR